MPCWYYDKKELRNTPSIQDDIDYETECRYRKEGARFIISAGTKMDLGYNTMATGVVYFHRFYMFHSFRNFPRFVTACCCLFLAGKVEETPKKCKDMITIAKSLLSEAKFAQFGDDPKEEVFALERILLQTIKFDLQVEHPYQFLLKYAKCLKGDKAKLQRMVQMAWTFVNDSLCTTLCLQWEPEVIAVALMYLAGKLSKFEVVDWVGRVPKHLFWWDMFVEDVTMTLLEDICHQVLDLYSTPQQVTPPDSPPLPRFTAFKKERVLPIPTVLSPNISQLTPSPLGKGPKPMAVEPKLPSQEKPLLISENSSSSQLYTHQSTFNNAPPPPPPPASVFPPSFSTPGGPGPSFSTPVPPAPAPPSPQAVFPPAFPATYPPPSTSQPPPLPPPNYYPRQPLGYFPNQ